MRSAAMKKRTEQPKARPVPHLQLVPKPRPARWRQSLALRARGLRREPIIRLQMKNWPLLRWRLVRQSLREHVAFDALVKGQGRLQHLLIINGVANLALVLAGWGLGVEYEHSIIQAQIVLKALEKFVPKAAPGKRVDLSVPVGKPGTCPLDAAGIEVVRNLLSIHHEQREQQECTRWFLAEAQADVERRVFADGNTVGADTPPPETITDEHGRQVLKANVGDVARLFKGALRQLREMTAPEKDSELDMLIASLETYFKVSQEVMSRSPALLVRQCAQMVADQAAKAAAEAQGANK